MDAPRPIEAIILAGGLGTRLRDMVGHVPKVLADVAGRPFIEYLLLQLRRAGIRDVTLCAGHMSDALADWAAGWAAAGGRSMEMKVRLSVEPEPLGTAGALKYAEPLLAGDRWLLMNGDSFFDISLERLVEAHDERPALVTMALARVADARRYGRVRCDADGLVLGFDEKSDFPGGGLINSGLYIIERPLLAQIPADRPASLEREVLPALAGRDLRGVAFDGYFIDIGIPEDYALAQEHGDVLGRLSPE